MSIFNIDWWRAPTIRPAGYRTWGFFNGLINRHTKKPHEHKRVIARAQRQADRIAKNRAARIGPDIIEPGRMVLNDPNVIGISRTGKTLYLADGKEQRLA